MTFCGKKYITKQNIIKMFELAMELENGIKILENMTDNTVELANSASPVKFHQVKIPQQTGI